MGSDQVWRPRYAKELGPYFFSFLEGTAARRIAYAASFGTAECEYTREERERCARLLAEFEGVSVRERTGIGQCRDYFGRDDTRQVLDPTLLLTAEDYRPLFIPGIARRRRSIATCSGPVPPSGGRSAARPRRADWRSSA